MARNKVQYQKGLSEAGFDRQYVTKLLNLGEGDTHSTENAVPPEHRLQAAPPRSMLRTS